MGKGEAEKRGDGERVKRGKFDGLTDSGSSVNLELIF